MAAIFTGIIDTWVGWNDNLSDGRANAISLDVHLDLIKNISISENVHHGTVFYCYTSTSLHPNVPILLTWINFKPSIDMSSLVK